MIFGIDPLESLCLVPNMAKRHLSLFLIIFLSLHLGCGIADWYLPWHRFWLPSLTEVQIGITYIEASDIVIM